MTWIIMTEKATVGPVAVPTAGMVVNDGQTKWRWHPPPIQSRAAGQTVPNDLRRRDPVVHATSTLLDSGRWDQAYRRDSAPWDIGRPQPVWVRLADGGEIRPPVLDSGCGTGENALLMAQRGMDVLGVDLSSTAIERARRKAKDRGLAAEFAVGDILRLDDLGRLFTTVIDSGAFHVFDDDERARYVASLASVVEPGGVLHLLCFSDQVPGEDGPRRISQAELREAFDDGWEVDRIEGAQFEVRTDWLLDNPHAWLARIVRL